MLVVGCRLWSVWLVCVALLVSPSVLLWCVCVLCGGVCVLSVCVVLWCVSAVVVCGRLLLMFVGYVVGVCVTIAVVSVVVVVGVGVVVGGGGGVAWCVGCVCVCVVVAVLSPPL